MFSSISKTAFTFALIFLAIGVNAAPTTSEISWTLQPTMKAVGAGRSVARNTLTVCRGDSVRFYWSGFHGVATTKPALWNSCSLTDYKDWIPAAGSGDKSIVMKKVGTQYVFCQVYGHCNSGQKIKIVTKKYPSSDTMVASDTRKSSIAFAIVASLLFCQLDVAVAAPTTSVIRWDMPISIDPVGAGRSSAGNVLTVCLNDSVVFNWQMTHGIVQDKRLPWQRCNLASASKILIVDPPTLTGTRTIVMNRPGTRYYYCQVPGNCRGGQKVKVIVGNAPC